MASSSFYSGSSQDATNVNAVEDSKNAAALSEAAAAASATAAANSAASGASSASTATTKASEGADSATASATSAAASQVSRVASEAAKVASETAKTSSETARDAAAASSVAATASQAAASSSETNAATSEAAALVSKNAAATSASTAAAEAANSATSSAASEVSNVASGVAKAAAETAEANAETAQAASEAARDAAAVSQAAAATSENNADSSATTSAAQAGVATTKASESAASAAAVLASEVAASTSETNAATSATNSANSATASETSRVASVAAQAAAETAEANSETAETNAAASASSASTSASNASTSETNAASSEGVSTAQAGISTTKSGEASASAAASLASQNASASSETAAATSEGNAANSATASETSRVASVAAQVASETAKTASQTAQTASEAARDAAAASEIALATSETNAAASEASASTDSATATTKAAEASASASNAASSAASAQASKDAALEALDSFDDRYLGQKTADPTVDNDGNALISGALYFNTTDEAMKVYEGSVWVAAYASLSGALLSVNNLSDVADVTATRTNLGLVIGTNVQAFSAILQNTTASFTTAEETKLAGIEAGATADQTPAQIKTAYESNADTNEFSDAEQNKLAGIEAGATGDQTPAQIKTAYESNANTNEFSDAEQNKLAGIEAGATADQTAAEIKTAYESNANTNEFSDAEQSKLAGIEAGATGDQTASEIRSLVEAATDSNVFTDADHNKLNAIEANANRITNTNQLTNGAGFITVSEVPVVDATAILEGNSSVTVVDNGSDGKVVVRVDGSDVAEFNDTHLAIPKGTTAQRDPAAVVGSLRYNTTTGFFETLTSSGWGAVATPPSITDITPSNFNGEAGATFTVNGAFFDADTTVVFKGADGTEYAAATVTFVNNSQLTVTNATNLPVANEPFKVKVTNGAGLSVESTQGIDAGSVPTFITTAGTLTATTRWDEAVSVTVNATDAENTISGYAVTEGNLPTGLTLNGTTGAITGTSTEQTTTTYTFTIGATDSVGNTNTRQFNIQIVNAAPVWNSPADFSTQHLMKNQAGSITLNATDPEGEAVSYTSATLPAGLFISGNAISGTPTVVANTSVAVTASDGFASSVRNFFINVARPPIVIIDGVDYLSGSTVMLSYQESDYVIECEAGTSVRFALAGGAGGRGGYNNRNDPGGPGGYVDQLLNFTSTVTLYGYTGQGNVLVSGKAGHGGGSSDIRTQRADSSSGFLSSEFSSSFYAGMDTAVLVAGGGGGPHGDSYGYWGNSDSPGAGGPTKSDTNSIGSNDSGHTNTGADATQAGQDGGGSMSSTYTTDGLFGGSGFVNLSRGSYISSSGAPFGEYTGYAWPNGGTGTSWANGGGGGGYYGGASNWPNGGGGSNFVANNTQGILLSSSNNNANSGAVNTGSGYIQVFVL